MPEYTVVAARQLALTGSVDAIDPNNVGGSSFLIKNPLGNSNMWLGPAADTAGTALSSSNGFLLEPGTSITLALTPSANPSPHEIFSVIGTATNKLHILVLQA